VLHLCFFLLGMGLMAPITAILQTMDYLNIYFAEYYPSRTLYTGYNTANLLALVVLFKFGERLWPNKRGRLLTGYSLYTVILVALPLVRLELGGARWWGGGWGGGCGGRTAAANAVARSHARPRSGVPGAAPCEPGLSLALLAACLTNTHVCLSARCAAD
jgi:hypothetical protein